MGFKWPDTISEKPLIQRFDGKTCHFKDGSTTDVDAVIMCTGYLHSYPFLEDSLRLRSDNSFYPNNLYKGTIWMGPEGNGNNAGDNKMIYIGEKTLMFFCYPLYIDMTDVHTCFINIHDYYRESRSILHVYDV